MRIACLDDTGNIAVWKASGEINIDLDEKYLVTGTVKEHSEYKGTKQTVLSRCKYEKLPKESQKCLDVQLAVV